MHNVKTIFTLIIITALVSCRSAVSFETPNNLRNINSTLYLKDGKAFSGKLVVNTDAALSSAVRLFQDGDKVPMKFNLSEVEGYEARGEYYALKNIKGGFTIGGRNYSFMKRLTRADSRIQMFEHIEVTNNRDRNGNVSSRNYEPQYFLQLPGDETNGVWALNSNKFVPNFDEKMSKMVADCPALAAKISNKESGYHYAQVSLFKEKRAEVLFNIIGEYNKCTPATVKDKAIMKQ